MSVALMRLVLRCDLPATVKLVLSAIVSHVNAGSDRMVAYPGLACLTWETQLSVSAVKRALVWLKERGILEYVGVFRPGRGDVSGFEVIVERLPERPAWREVSEAVRDELARKKRGSHRAPFQGLQGARLPGISTGKGALTERKGAHTEPERGSATREKGLTQSPEVDLRSRSESESEQKHRASRGARADADRKTESGPTPDLRAKLDVTRLKMQLPKMKPQRQLEHRR
jgi:hypothetical protein